VPGKLDDLALKIEALLFASGTPLSVSELTEKAGAPDFRAVQHALRYLVRAYGGRQTSVEIRRVGDRYALQLKEAYLPDVQAVQPVEIAPKTLKALTLIAYHQPMLQSFLVKMVGDSAYAEVQELRNLGLIRADPKGSTLELTTTARFSEYFGIGSNRIEDIRQFLTQKLGVTDVDPLPASKASADGTTPEGRTPSSDSSPATPVPGPAPPTPAELGLHPATGTSSTGGNSEAPEPSPARGSVRPP
jgi:segregation and condensation protein B